MRRRSFDPVHVRKVLERCWSARTARQWSQDNPASGQCAVTAMVLQDAFGGSLLKTRVAGAWHFYNRIDGGDHDLTASQFPAPVSYSDLPATRCEALAGCTSAEYEELSRCFSACAHAGTTSVECGG